MGVLTHPTPTAHLTHTISILLLEIVRGLAQALEAARTGNY